MIPRTKIRDGHRAGTRTGCPICDREALRDERDGFPIPTRHTFAARTPDPIAKVTTFAAGVAHERGRNIAQNTRRSPIARERALLAEGMRLLAVGPFGARQAAWLLAGYVEGVEGMDERGMAS